MSMSQRSIAAYTTRRPYDSTPFRSHARSAYAAPLAFAFHHQAQDSVAVLGAWRIHRVTPRGGLGR